MRDSPFQFLTSESDNKKSVAVLKDDASVSIMLPRNSSWVQVDGLLGPQYGVVSMSLNPPPPDGPAETISVPTNSPWVVSDTFVNFPLNPDVRYNLTLSTHAATAGEGVYLDNTMIIPYDNEYVWSQLCTDISTRSYWLEDNNSSNSQGSPNVTTPQSELDRSWRTRLTAAEAKKVPAGAIGGAVVSVPTW